MKPGDRVISKTSLGLVSEQHPFRFIDRIEEGTIGTIIEGVPEDVLPGSAGWMAVRFDGHEKAPEGGFYAGEPLVAAALPVHLELLEPLIERAMEGDR